MDRDDIADIFGRVNTIVNAYGPRIPGSRPCVQAATHIERECKNVCDETQVQEFDLHPGSFYGITKIIVITYIAGSALYLLHGGWLYASWLIYTVGMFYFIHQFIFLGNFFDGIFPRRPGCNVIGTVQPRQEARQQIIISGHHDSTYICNFLENNQQYYAARLIAPMLLFLYAMAASLISAIFEFGGTTHQAFHAVSAGFIIAGLVFVIPLYWYHGGEGTPGAGDNLLASVMCIKAVEVIKRDFGPLQCTRLIIVSTDGEECGQKGAQAFIARYRGAMARIKTYVFNIDSIYASRDLALLKSERNGTVQLPVRQVNEVKSLAEEMGYPINVKSMPLGGGGTDAGQFARAGFETTSLIGISTDLVRRDIYYHTSRDVSAHIDPDAVEAAMNILVGYILKKDAEAAVAPSTG